MLISNSSPPVVRFWFDESRACRRHTAAPPSPTTSARAAAAKTATFTLEVTLQHGFTARALAWMTNIVCDVLPARPPSIRPGPNARHLFASVTEKNVNRWNVVVNDSPFCETLRATRASTSQHEPAPAMGCQHTGNSSASSSDTVPDVDGARPERLEVRCLTRQLCVALKVSRHVLPRLLVAEAAIAAMAT
jgi:hypothetical protein